jgi:hypothetical protein
MVVVCRRIPRNVGWLAVEKIGDKNLVSALRRVSMGKYVGALDGLRVETKDISYIEKTSLGARTATDVYRKAENRIKVSRVRLSMPRDGSAFECMSLQVLSPKIVSYRPLGV